MDDVLPQDFTQRILDAVKKRGEKYMNKVLDIINDFYPRGLTLFKVRQMHDLIEPHDSREDDNAWDDSMYSGFVRSTSSSLPGGSRNPVVHIVLKDLRSRLNRDYDSDIISLTCDKYMFKRDMDRKMPRLQITVLGKGKDYVFGELVSIPDEYYESGNPWNVYKVKPVFNSKKKKDFTYEGKINVSYENKCDGTAELYIEVLSLNQEDYAVHECEECDIMVRTNINHSCGWAVDSIIAYGPFIG